MKSSTWALVVAIGLALPLRAVTIQYIQFPPGTGLTFDNVTQPVIVTLPCYGDVRVTIVPIDPPDGAGIPGTPVYKAAVNPYVNNAPRSVAGFSWTSATGFGLLSQTADYNVTFDFLNGIPDPSRLVLVVTGLRFGSTAALSVPATSIGELHIPPNDPICPNNTCLDSTCLCDDGTPSCLCTNGTAPTIFDGIKFSSGYTPISGTPGFGTDDRNTGWALVQPKVTSATLTMKMHHVAGDGLGWSLAYVCEPGLTVKKVVQGAPAGFKGSFPFLVQCMTRRGVLITNVVNVDWPAPGSAAVGGIPSGSTCKVTESQNLPAAPTDMSWSTVVYSPTDGVVVTNDAGSTVTAVNSLRTCRDKCDVRIVKRVEGVPFGFSGTFGGTLRCWINGTMTAFPVTIAYPFPGFFTVKDLPLAGTCTFEETTAAALPSPYQWLPPLYSTDFGRIVLAGACAQELVVTNRAKLCCDSAPILTTEPATTRPKS